MDLFDLVRPLYPSDAKVELWDPANLEVSSGFCKERYHNTQLYHELPIRDVSMDSVNSIVDSIYYYK